MLEPISIDDEAKTLPDSDRDHFAEKDAERASSDPNPVAHVSLPEPAGSSWARTAALPFLAATLITALDRVADRSLGANTGVSLFLVLPVYWAVRVAGARTGVLVAASGALLWLFSELLAPPAAHPGWLPFWTGGIHLAFFAFAVALAIEHRRLLAERSLATTDFLTGVYNRRGFYQAFEREMERSRRYHMPLTLLYLDCDGFKAVNDTRGHPAGNRLLVRIAALLKESTRGSDIVGRLGGDEFGVVLVEMASDRGAEVAERLRERMRLCLGPEAPFVTLSIGAITFDSPPADPTEAIRIADALMYEAKRSGKDRVVHAVASERSDHHESRVGGTSRKPA